MQCSRKEHSGGGGAEHMLLPRRALIPEVAILMQTAASARGSALTPFALAIQTAGVVGRDHSKVFF